MTAPTLGIVRPRFPSLYNFHSRFDEALGSGQVTNGGPWVVEFERQLSEYLGVPTIVFNNGQAALMTMLRAAGINGGEVICPSFTFAATPHAIRWTGGEPVFADVDPETMTLDPADVARRITPDTTAILAVDPYGIPCDDQALSAVAAAAGHVTVLVDSAASFGSTSSGSLYRNYADASIFSFHATKAFSTMEGGALCSVDKALLDRARRIRNFGQDENGDCSQVGLNGKMLEICALVGIEQLRGWHKARDHRLATATNLRAEIMRMDIPGVTVPRTPTHLGPIWLYRPILVDESAFGMSRDEVAAKMGERGVGVRKYYSPTCHLMSCYLPYPNIYSQDPKVIEAKQPISLPITERLSSTVLALPVFNDMTMEEVTHVATTLREVYEVGK